MEPDVKSGAGEVAPAFVQSPKTLGALLVEANLISSKQLEQAEELQRTQKKRLGDVLVEQRFIKPEDLAAMASLQMNVPFIDLKRHTIQPAALKLVPERVARKHNVVPLDVVGDALVVVMAYPDDIQAVNDLVTLVGMKIEPAIGVPADIREAINLNYSAVGEIVEEMRKLVPAVQKEVGAQVSLAETGQDAPIVRAANSLINEAVRGRASDIHLEPQKDRLRVRYRIDGVLHDIVALPLGVHPALVSRIKILAGMNIAERRLPQDGQFSVSADGREVDVRAASIETAHGEGMVLRILDKSTYLLDLSNLGFLPDVLATYRKMLSSPYGLILDAGPTGSGKTTTLYASVNELDRRARNIVTIEDPIEYLFDDINQIQVNPKGGITFARGLRAIMRLDPDVILIGEMRDSDTAGTGIQAAQTGHLVLSSIHSNDAVGALSRLMNLGVERFLLASAIIGVVAQRMVRRICPHCRSLVERPAAEQASYEKEVGELRSSFYYGAGCNFCAHTGYLGRTIICEVLQMSEKVRQLVVSGASAAEIKEQALKDGMVTMLRDGMLKVREAITTPSEVIRNVFFVE